MSWTNNDIFGKAQWYPLEARVDRDVAMGLGFLIPVGKRGASGMAGTDSST